MKPNQKKPQIPAQPTSAWTVKQVATMSGVTIRTLRFYDQAGLLKPARHGANGYRFYEKPQLLTLQQILFYRELGFPLREIRKILRRRDFDKIPALQSHRETLQKNLNRTRTLIETVDNTIKHLKGKKPMESRQLFAGFTIPANNARFGERFEIGGKEPADCKLSARDTGGAVATFEFTGYSGGPRAMHYEEDEWIYVVSGNIYIEVAGQHFRLGPGESIFIPRKTSHAWSCFEAGGAKIIDTYTPAGKIEAFFRNLVKPPKCFDVTKEQIVKNLVPKEQIDEMHKFFDAYGMDLTGPPMMEPPAAKKLKRA